VAEGPLHSGLQNRSPLCLALKGELTQETASKTDENDSLLPHERFFSSLVFATVAHSALSAWQIKSN